MASFSFESYAGSMYRTHRSSLELPYTCKCGHVQFVSAEDVEEQCEFQLINILDGIDPFVYGVDGGCIVNRNVEIECKMCQEYIDVIIEVRGASVWDDSREYADPRFEYFTVTNVQVLPSDAQVGFSTVNYFEYEPEYDYFPDIWDVEKPQKKNSVTLKIIAITAMFKGFCHMGFEEQSGRILRPFYRPQEGCCCWDAPLEIDGMYTFKILRSPGDGLKSLTPLPHSNEDLYVDYKDTVREPNGPTPPWYDTFQRLQMIAKSSVEDIFGFGIINQYKYVDEGTDCPSVGVLECRGRDLELSRDRVCNRKRSISIGPYTFRITAKDSKEIPEALPDHPTLVILGLARPFAGTRNNHFHPRRCYILALRILQKPLPY